MWVTPKDEPAIVREELEKARARLRSLERAPFEGRVTHGGRHERALHFARLRVQDLERELATLDASLGRDELGGDFTGEAE